MFSKYCALEKRRENQRQGDSFFLFLRCEEDENLESTRFFTKISYFATCDLSAQMRDTDLARPSDAFD